MVHPEETSIPAGGRSAAKPVRGRRSATAHPPQDAVGRQAREIIDDVLDPGSDCEETIRQGLRRHVAARPGRPDLALLEHVLALRGRNWRSSSRTVDR